MLKYIHLAVYDRSNNILLHPFVSQFEIRIKAKGSQSLFELPSVT